ncbi:MAG: 16S rRNA (uracil(1498)-N(3))-methyltransferase [Verrucomicrobia bacterium]|nr:16S rRNA (uracil(1498)-N(3))-methyltransferase [Verrucomicrobiota bacterium]MCH8528399.1 16S rRNA (uracil(1498)-N(3))-methyltransferase [Kiritimatiellia bacterium]
MNLPDFRCFADVERLEPGELSLSPEESRHLSQVRRAGVGTDVMVLNGRGDRGGGELIRCEKKAAEVLIHSVERCAPSLPKLTLYVGGLKQAAWDEVLRYAGELGVDRLVWLQSDHAVAELKKDRVDEKCQRWRDKLIQSLKQCGNPWLPALAVCFSVDESLAGTEGEDGRLVAALCGDPPPIGGVLAGRGDGDLRVWIGPEGDYSEREYGLFAAAGVRPVSLGPRILRAETAVLATAAVLRLG